jgi:hypothetical protein
VEPWNLEQGLSEALKVKGEKATKAITIKVKIITVFVIFFN